MLHARLISIAATTCIVGCATAPHWTGLNVEERLIDGQVTYLFMLDEAEYTRMLNEGGSAQNELKFSARIRIAARNYVEREATARGICPSGIMELPPFGGSTNPWTFIIQVRCNAA